MPSRIALLVLACGIAATANIGCAAAASLKPIYKVDSVAATIQGREMTIIASGAVATGGWTHPLLRPKLHRAEDKTLEFQFVASPPSPSATVIQALVPVTVKRTMRLPPYGVTQIKIDAESNSAIASIAR